jgi:adenylate kinase family enzyme
VRLPNRIHIVGASGSGTTSLAVEIAGTYGYRHLDTDDYYWLRTVPPYREKRPEEERLALLRQAFSESKSWVLSGSLCGWGDPLISQFELVVFLVVPMPVRLARLLVRERARYGQQAIASGGELHEAHVEFLDWAGRYDTGGVEMRSRVLHEVWLATVSCPVIRLEGDLSADEQLGQLQTNLEAGLLTSRFSGPAAPAAERAR